MRDDAKFKKSLAVMQKHGPIGLTKLAALTDECRVTLRRRMEFCEYNGLVEADRGASPIQFKTVDEWEQKFDAYVAKRDQDAAERGARLKALYPAEPRKSKRNRGYVAKADDRAHFPELLAACVAIRPEVRTAWRGQPQWSAA